MSAAAEAVLNDLCRDPKRPVRTTKDVARELLLHGDFMAGGYLYSPRLRHLGLGIYEVSARSRP